MTNPDLGKAYEAPGITVYFNSVRCRHFAECIKGLPTVFDSKARPWIQPGQATADQVAEVVRRCPSGALHYQLADGLAETGDPVTTITPTIGGPLLIRGVLRLIGHDADGAETTHFETRMAACACARSLNLPFCDGACSAPG